VRTTRAGRASGASRPGQAFRQQPVLPVPGKICRGLDVAEPVPH